MSHALYDGLSSQYIVQCLHEFFRGEGRLVVPLKLAPYVSHALYSRHDAHAYWRSVLQNSSPTMLRNSSPMLLEPGAPQICFAEKLIYAPMQVNSDRITPATVFTTACALVLGKETRSIDVFLGRVVSGQQSLPETLSALTNDVPFRVQLQGKDKESLKAALRDVQSQYLEGMPFQTLGFDDLKENCTNRPDTAKYYSACAAY